MDALAETRAILGDLIAFPTISSDSNLELVVYIADRLSDLGASVELFKDDTGTKASIFARLGPEAPRGLLFSGHTDVVPVEDQDWTSNPFALRETDGRLFGRGACDMKGFVAAALAVASGIDPARLKRPLFLAFTYDEEVGCLGARQLISHIAGHELLPSMAIVGEPTEMRVIDGHKGCCEYTTVFSGLEGHGSDPDRGVNALDAAVRYASRLMELREALKGRAPTDSRFDPPWTTINIGRLTGGVARNVIASHAELEWEMRPVRGEDVVFVKGDLDSFARTELLPRMQRDLPQADIVTEVVGEIDGLHPVRDNPARDLVIGLTGVNAAGTVAFGTEAGLFQAAGMDTIVCGPGSIEQAHKADEFVSVDQLALCLDLLGRLADDLVNE